MRSLIVLLVLISFPAAAAAQGMGSTPSSGAGRAPTPIVVPSSQWIVPSPYLPPDARRSMGKIGTNGRATDPDWARYGLHLPETAAQVVDVCLLNPKLPQCSVRMEFCLANPTLALCQKN